MNTKQATQILPVIEHIGGYGNVMDLPITEVMDRCNKVLSFMVGDILVRRIEGSGPCFSKDSWVIDSGLGLTMVDMNWPGMGQEFEQGMY